jgi:nitroreductase
MFDLIRSRRSVRNFLSKKIPRDDLEKILDMGRFAPTAGNKQPWKFLILETEDIKLEFRNILIQYWTRFVQEQSRRNEEKKSRISELKKVLNNIFRAPIIIFIFVNTKSFPDLVIFDGVLAAQNILLASHALGYASSFQTTYFPEDAVKEFFSIPSAFKFVCALPIGKIALLPRIPKKKPLNSFIWEDKTLVGSYERKRK